MGIFDLDVGTRLEGGPSWRLSGPEFGRPMTDADRLAASAIISQLTALPEDHPEAIDG